MVPAGASPDWISNILQNCNVDFFLLTSVAVVKASGSSNLEEVSNLDDENGWNSGPSIFLEDGPCVLAYCSYC